MESESNNTGMIILAVIVNIVFFFYTVGEIRRERKREKQLKNTKK